MWLDIFKRKEGIIDAIFYLILLLLLKNGIDILSNLPDENIFLWCKSKQGQVSTLQYSNMEKKKKKEPPPDGKLTKRIGLEEKLQATEF